MGTESGTAVARFAKERRVRELLVRRWSLSHRVKALQTPAHSSVFTARPVLVCT